MSFNLEALYKIRNASELYTLALDFNLELKQQGNTWVALCPFHSEHTPSFCINTNTNRYKCFGCGAFGDSFSFVCKMKGCSFLEALDFLANKYNISITQQTSSKQDVDYKDLESLKELQEFFAYYLVNSDTNSFPCSYLYKRGITKSMIQFFGIGFCPSSNIIIQKFPNLLYKSSNLGIISTQQTILFANRITFPICDLSGHTLGWSGRSIITNSSTLKPVSSKYLNSKESKLFKKSQVSFGLHISKPHIIKQKKVIFVEGFIDFIKSFYGDVKNVFCLQGTSISDYMITMFLKWQITEVVIVCDPDTAGRTAAIKIAQKTMKNLLYTKMVLLPDNLDPDGFISKYGANKFREYINLEWIPLPIFWARHINLTLSTTDSINPIHFRNAMQTMLELDIPGIGNTANKLLSQFCTESNIIYDSLKNVILRWKLNPPSAHNKNTTKYQHNGSTGHSKTSIIIGIKMLLKFCITTLHTDLFPLRHSLVHKLWIMLEELYLIPTNLCVIWKYISNQLSLQEPNFSSVINIDNSILNEIMATEMLSSFEQVFHTILLYYKTVFINKNKTTPLTNLERVFLITLSQYITQHMKKAR